MGYTHYWTLPDKITDSDWNAFRDKVEELVDHAYLTGIPLAWEYDQRLRKPELTEDVVRFNGVEDDGHETFLISRAGRRWTFCKTARKPYDTVVVACLMAAAKYIEGFHWSSDGSAEDGEFDDAFRFAESMERAAA